MRPSQLLALCLSVAPSALADPKSNGIRVENRGAFSGWFYVKSGAHESRHSGLLDTGQDHVFSFDDLVRNGFSDGENCWVDVDVEAGATNHESGDNFDLSKTGNTETYKLTGSSLYPSWSRQFG
ncbi:hypothetical protein F4823DRAFT_567662 [Ustulina deusta]|nr:hypothetical protein F4823DRAFT_567662 [Ustulina deusta]